jgi:hypothetical protein
MKPLLFSWALGAALAAAQSPDSTVRFFSTPGVQRFPDGAVEWSGIVSCPDPAKLSGTMLAWTWDRNLDGIPDGTSDSSALVPAECEGGKARVLRTLFPEKPGILLATLRRGGIVLDQFAAASSMGRLLAIRRFCARPSSGESEWVQLENLADQSLDLGKIRIQGKPLIPSWIPPRSVWIFGPDSTALKNVFASVPAQTVAGWKSLRNTGDTLRLTWEGAILDSAVFGSSAPEPREACGDAKSPLSQSSAYGLEFSSRPWNADQALEISVRAPVDAPYSLAAYDLDGHRLCAIASAGPGPQRIFWRPAACRGLSERVRTGAVLIQLRPRGAAPLRKIVALRP